MQKYIISFFMIFLLSPLFAAEQQGFFNVRDFGAAGDGKTKDTASIQKAIDACTTAGGGTVTLPAGTYLSGSLYLKHNVDFHLMSGAELLGSPDPQDYNPVDICPQNTASKLESTSGTHLILCIEQKNVTVRGPGRINGNCLNCTVLNLDKDGKKLPGHAGIKWRPAQMVYFVESENIRLLDLELIDSPYWSCFIHGCSHVKIDRVNIQTRRSVTHNGDGIDIDSSQYVTVSNCRFFTSDDSLTLRANTRLLKNPKPCRYVTVTNCILSSGQACIRIGVGNGKIQDAVFTNLVLEGANMGICLCPGWGKNATDIDNIRFDNISVDCQRPFVMFFYSNRPSKIENVYFSRISGRYRGTSMLLGTARDTSRNIQFSDIDLESLVPGKIPMEVFRVDGLTLDRVRMNRNSEDKVGDFLVGNVNGLKVNESIPKVKLMSQEEMQERDRRGSQPY